MAEPSRIEQLRRRVQRNPASIAFAALAEEYHRAGQHEEAIATCRAGLRRHAAYLSPRVTLGRALLATGRCEEARAELEGVLRAAPDHVMAMRALEDAQSQSASSGTPGQRPAEPSAGLPEPATKAGLPALPALEAFLAAIRRARGAAGRHPAPPVG